jgi:hypothetical protein
MKFFKYFLILLALGANNVFAGSINFENKNYEDVKTGDEILITINFDTENESYNTISGNLSIDESFEIKQIKTGNSIISAWIENPSKSKNNNIKFSGIIAGGFNGQGTIFEIIATPKISGYGNLKLEDVFIYKNDGSGTEEKISEKNLNISVREILPGESNSKISIIDKISPEKFVVELVKDINIENGKYVLVFEAIDKGTGIKTYEVLEGKKLFKQAESPYVLKNQRINERIYVKAIDYEGNERVSRVDIPNKICIGVRCFNQNITIIILAIAFISSFIIWRKQSKEFKKISKIVS